MLSTLCLIVAAAGAVSAQAVVHVPGTRVSLEPPQGFTLAQRFPGFERSDPQFSIMVTEMPSAPVAHVMTGMSKEEFARRGMTLISSERQKIEGRDALLLQLAQDAAGTTFLKWMLITGDPNNSVLIVGTFPKSADAAIGHAIRTAVLTASWSPGGAGINLDGLSFRVTPTATLKLARRMGNMLLLTESGGTAGPMDTIYVVGASVSAVRVSDLQSFAEARARQTPELQELINFNGRPVTMGELNAYELVGRERPENRQSDAHVPSDRS